MSDDFCLETQKVQKITDVRERNETLIEKADQVGHFIGWNQEKRDDWIDTHPRNLYVIRYQEEAFGNRQ